MSRGNITEQDDFAEADHPSYLKKLDVACGNNKQKNFTGVDVSPDCQADVIHDLNTYPYPFDDGSIYEIHCSHFVEHVQDIKAFMEECHRILIPLGTMTIRAPYYTSIRAWQDFTHVRAISENTFTYFSQKWLKEAGLSHYGIKCDFDIIHTRFFFEPEWTTKSAAAQKWAMKHYTNVVSDIEVTLRAIK